MPRQAGLGLSYPPWIAILKIKSFDVIMHTKLMLDSYLLSSFSLEDSEAMVMVMVMVIMLLYVFTPLPNKRRVRKQ